MTCSLFFESFCNGVAEQDIELLEGYSIVDQASVHYESHELAESHGVVLGFRKCSKQLVESTLVVLLEYNSVMSQIAHLKLILPDSLTHENII